MQCCHYCVPGLIPGLAVLRDVDTVKKTKANQKKKKKTSMKYHEVLFITTLIKRNFQYSRLIMREQDAKSQSSWRPGWGDALKPYFFLFITKNVAFLTFFQFSKHYGGKRGLRRQRDPMSKSVRKKKITELLVWDRHSFGWDRGEHDRQ